MRKPDHDRLVRVVAEARRTRELRVQDYRERALRIYPWICGRCGREFDTAGRDATAGGTPAAAHQPFANLRSLPTGKS